MHAVTIALLVIFFVADTAPVATSVTPTRSDRHPPTTPPRARNSAPRRSAAPRSKTVGPGSDDDDPPRRTLDHRGRARSAPRPCRIASVHPTSPRVESAPHRARIAADRVPVATHRRLRQRASARSQRIAVRLRPVEARRHAIEVRLQRIEVRLQRIEVRLQRIEVRRHRIEARRQRIEARRQRMDVRRQRIEVRQQRTAVRARNATRRPSCRALTPPRASARALEPLTRRSGRLLSHQRPPRRSPLLGLRRKELEKTFVFRSPHRSHPRATPPRPERRSIRHHQPVDMPRPPRRPRVDAQQPPGQPDHVQTRRAVETAKESVHRNALNLDHVRRSRGRSGAAQSRPGFPRALDVTKTRNSRALVARAGAMRSSASSDVSTFVAAGLSSPDSVITTRCRRPAARRSRLTRRH